MLTHANQSHCDIIVLHDNECDLQEHELIGHVMRKMDLLELIAEHLSARLLIVRCSQLAFVCIYIYICMYIYMYIHVYMYIYSSHFNCVGAVSVVSSPYYEPCSTGLTTRRSRRDRASQNWAGQGHVVLVRLGGDRRVKKIVREPKWNGSGLSVIMLESVESENGNKGKLHQESKAKEKESDRLRKKRCTQGESRVALHLAHFLKLFTPPLCQLHRYLHVVTTDIYLHISGYPSAWGILCAYVFLVFMYKLKYMAPWNLFFRNVRTAYEIFGPPYIQAQLKSMYPRNIDEELATCLNICTGVFYRYKFNVTVAASSAVVTTQWM